MLAVSGSVVAHSELELLGDELSPYRGENEERKTMSWPFCRCVGECAGAGRIETALRGW